MDAVTYPDEAVAKFLNEAVIPLQLPHDHQPLSEQFNVKWTPTLVIVDTAGKEHHRTVGFLGPDELVPMILLGLGKSFFETGRFDEAIAAFDRLIAEFPGSVSVPEAIFVRGVSLYKNTKDPKPLRAAYDKLTAEHPGSDWTKRAFPYRLIN
jgi:tetratricopeptide (TPR) repeat protein